MDAARSAAHADHQYGAQSEKIQFHGLPLRVLRVVREISLNGTQVGKSATRRCLVVRTSCKVVGGFTVDPRFGFSVQSEHRPYGWAVSHPAVKRMHGYYSLLLSDPRDANLW